MGFFEDLVAGAIGYSITKIERGTYAGNNINVVVIPKHINYIGEYAFNANPIEKIIIYNRIS